MRYVTLNPCEADGVAWGGGGFFSFELPSPFSLRSQRLSLMFLNLYLYRNRGPACVCFGFARFSTLSDAPQCQLSYAVRDVDTARIGE